MILEQIELDFKLDKKDISNFIKFQENRSGLIKSKIREMRIIYTLIPFFLPVVMTLFAVFTNTLNNWDTAIFVLWIPFILVSVAAYILSPISMEKKQEEHRKKWIKRYMKEDPPDNTNIIFTNEKIIAEDSKGKIERKWIGIREIVHHQTAIYLYTSREIAIILPNRFINEKYDVKDVLETLNHYYSNVTKAAKRTSST